MNPQDKDADHQEAIRTLAKLSASKQNLTGTDWVDPQKERQARDRIGSFYDPNHVEVGANDEKPISKRMKATIFWIRAGLLAFVLYSLYNTLSAS